MSLNTVQCIKITPCPVMPTSLCVWHKANTIDPIAIVKAVHFAHTVFVRELSRELSIQVWITLGAPLQRELEYVPLFNILGRTHHCHCYHSSGKFTSVWLS
ncbi:hypothetical protein KSC_030040 [Ktedonobacter sp. SOSP1-52]|nr:hypothetical protein KSC_030040 [Ktedonobacter sp. SOSP1-52]